MKNPFSGMLCTGYLPAEIYSLWLVQTNLYQDFINSIFSAKYPEICNQYTAFMLALDNLIDGSFEWFADGEGADTYVLQFQPEEVCDISSADLKKDS